jgi:hypothetical protein
MRSHALTIHLGDKDMAKVEREAAEGGLDGGHVG